MKTLWSLPVWSLPVWSLAVLGGVVGGAYLLAVSPGGRTPSPMAMYRGAMYRGATGPSPDAEGRFAEARRLATLADSARLEARTDEALALYRRSLAVSNNPLLRLEMIRLLETAHRSGDALRDTTGSSGTDPPSVAIFRTR